MTLTADKLFPGDIFFTKIHGLPGWNVNLGQAIIGDSSRYHHTGLILDQNELAEARPPEARIHTVDALLRDHPEVVVFRLPLSPEQRVALVQNVRHDLESGVVRYGWSAYLNMAFLHWGMKPNQFRAYLDRNGRMICSQLVDHYLQRIGYHVFNDGRQPYDVSPGDLVWEFFLNEKVVLVR